MTGLFTLKILYQQDADVHKVVIPYGYIFTSQRDTICSFYDVADTNIAVVAASVRANLQWLSQNVQSYSVALILVNMRASSVNEWALKLKSSSIAGNYA